MTSSLTPERVAQYHAAGFLAIERLIDGAAVSELRTAYDELLEGRVAAPFDRELGGITRQLMHPSFTHPSFDANPALAAGRAIVAALYPDRVIARTFDMLIFKPPGHPHETPWHQDYAYRFSPLTRAGAEIPDGVVQFWVALDDADVGNGCMHFLPGLHRKPLLEHVVASGDPSDDGRLLGLRDAAQQVDLSQIVARPLRAGGCTLHDYGTPHYTPPNRSSLRPRRAYIFNLIAGGAEIATVEPNIRAHLRAQIETEG